MNSTCRRFFQWALIAVSGVLLHAEEPVLKNVDGTPFSLAGVRHLVILIHGWNPTGATDKFKDGEWAGLVDNLQSALMGSDWYIAECHWESMADTGSALNIAVTDLGDWGTATEAAANATIVGGSLGFMLKQYPSLRQVQIVAHSAGSWAAKEAAQVVLQANPYVTVQVTLLDPYIPDNPNPISSVPPTVTGLSTASMSAMRSVRGADRIRRLENYYAYDFPGWDITKQLAPTFGTQETFSWSSADINQQVNWGVSVPLNPIANYSFYYDWHSGPIQFYADTIKAATPGSIVPSALYGTGCPFEFTQVGWYRSLPFEASFLPRINSQPLSKLNVPEGQSVTISVGAVSSRPLSYEWFKDGVSLRQTGTSCTFAVSAATVGEYVVKVSSDQGDVYSDAALITMDAAPPIQIDHVYPTVLAGVATPGTQRIQIFGAGFTSTSTLTFSDGVNAPYAGRVPVFVSTGELDYNVAVGTNSANWTVQVVDGDVESNVGSFGVVAPPAPSSGSLSVSLAPQSALASGAQWQVDGGPFHASGEVVSNLTPGTHSIACKPVAGYATPVARTVSIVGGQVLADTETYTTIAPTNYTLTLQGAGTQGSVSPSPTATNNSYPAGATVQLSASPGYGYHFTGWGGDLSGAANPATITMDRNKTVAANFASGDPRLGTVTVTIQPQAAADAGVTWGFNASDYRASGSSYTTFPATYLLTLHPVDGWLGAANLVATVTAGQTTNVTATFTADMTPGLLTVTMSPPAAAGAGAQWHANGGTGHGSGASVSLAPGTYTVSFDALPGWIAPPNQTVTVFRAKTSVSTAAYSPPVGQPTITSVVPSIGALAGGTTLTVNGSNFTPGTTVSVGGVPATAVSVTSDSQLTCTTPAGAVYGTASVLVQTAVGSASAPTGFTYGAPRGDGLVLEGSIGGYVYATAAQGNYGYIGEGSTFRVLDISNPSAPSPVGQVALPGIIQDIALFSANGHTYAAVADGDAGLQIVDVTTPAAPLLRGYYAFDQAVYGVTVVNTVAYVGAGNAGFCVLDVSDPAHPKKDSEVATGGFANRLNIVAANGKTTAYLINSGTLASIDVTDPTQPSLQGQTARVLSAWYNPGSIAISGSVAYLAGSQNNIQAVDISDPANPRVIGIATSNGAPAAVSATNGYLYAWDNNTLAVYQPALNGTLQRLGVVFASGQSANGSLTIVGSTALGAGGEHGLYLYDVSNPSSPQYRGVFNPTAGGYVGTADVGPTLLAATQNSGLKIFDVTDPAAPVLLSQYVSSFNGGFGGDAVSVVGNRAFFLGVGQLNTLDVSNPRAPVVYGFTSQSKFFIWDFQPLSSATILVAGADATTAPYKPAFGLLNLSDPTSPQFQSLIYPSTPAGGVIAIAANTAIACVAVPLASGHSSLAVFDDSQLSNLRQVGQLADIGNVPTRALRLSPDGKHLFVGCAGSATDLNWKIIDVSNSAAPALLSATAIDASVVGFAFTGKSVVLATGKGVSIYDISDFTNPKLTRTYSMPYPSSAVQVSGETVYVSDVSGGVSALSITDRDPPSVLITSPVSDQAFTTTASTIDLAGSASDAQGLVVGTVKSVSWSNSRGGGGAATGTTSWSVAGIGLQPGTNVISMTATDNSGNSGTATLTVTSTLPKQDQSITVAPVADHVFGDAPIPLIAAATSGLPVVFRVVNGPASISGNLLTLTGAGAVSIEASQPGDDAFNAALPVDVTFNVAKSAQTIAFAPVATPQADGAPFALSAMASSGLKVYFTVVSGPAAVADNVVTLLGSGTVTISAWQPGNENFNPAASVQQSFIVTPVPQSINFGLLSTQRIGDAPFALAATASSGLPVSFAVVSGPASLVGNVVTVTGAGTVTIRASQPGDGTFGTATSVERSFVVAAPPTITTQPSGQTINAGDSMALTVVAVGTEPLGYQWRKAGASIYGATNPSLVIASTQPSDSGPYDVVVSNGTSPDAVSSPASVNVIPTGVSATHTLQAYAVAGGNRTVSVNNTFNNAGGLTDLSWSVLLPSGWSLVSTDAAGAGTVPAGGATSLLEWKWPAPTTTPITFTYVLAAPLADTRPHPISALVAFDYSNTPIQMTARVDPLTVAFYHTADEDLDNRISLIELTRVIELYNTRNGTTRTGCYAVATTTTEDGFAPDAGRAGGVAAALGRYHTADENHDGAISLLELTRVIELYNYRTGTQRTGQYHVQAGTEDGFAPGP